ncbi:MAG TPA: hypothetical protein VGS41_17905 [Chthonomonadales bacterium]|nr:hypothetical protein [Chthonomonadales bacterium]
MKFIVTPSQRAASALSRAERALRNWQDDPDSPRSDVDRMLAIIEDLRSWVQGHVLADIEHAEALVRDRRRQSAPPAGS